MDNLEVWKPVVGFEGYFEVSNKGNVRSLDREVFVNPEDKVPHVYKGKVLKKQVNGHGYETITLTVRSNDIKKRRYVHQLVAEAFIGNPNGYHDINHINEIKTDNRVENLEYCDRAHNINHGTLPKRKHHIMLINTKKRFPKVEQYDKEGNLLRVYANASVAGRANKYHQGGIQRACRGERKYYMGYVWKYQR